MEEFTNKELDVSELPKLEEQTFEKLHRNYLKLIVIFRVFLSALILLGLGVTWIAKDEIPTGAVLGAMIGGAAFGILFTGFGYFGFFKKGFALRDKDVSYRRGLIFHSITVVPLNRIQHSELVRGPFDRLLGLASVKIYTAGGSTSDITIPGLPVVKAENIREFITNKIKAEEHVAA